jgi:hypothetical protein
VGSRGADASDTGLRKVAGTLNKRVKFYPYNERNFLIGRENFDFSVRTVSRSYVRIIFREEFSVMLLLTLSFAVLTSHNFIIIPEYITT